MRSTAAFVPINKLNKDGENGKKYDPQVDENYSYQHIDPHELSLSD